MGQAMDDLAKGLLALCLLVLLPVADAAAHGEKAQPAALRMRSVHWYDTEIDRSNVTVNDTVTLKGKFYLSTSWLQSSQGRVTAFLHTATPGPMLLRLETKINGVAQDGPAGLELGGRYRYEIALKARVPGRSHVHVVLHVEGTGPLTGPGKWVEVTGDAADFTPPYEAMAGAEFGTETGTGSNGIAWIGAWAAMAGLWAAYWAALTGTLPGPGARPKSRRGQGVRGAFDNGIRMLGPPMFFMTVGLAVATLNWLVEGGPSRTPSERGVVLIEPLPEPLRTVEAKVERAVYSIPSRSLQMEMKVRNDTNQSLRLGEVGCAYLRFINPDVLKGVKFDAPDDSIAPQGLTVEGGPIAPVSTGTLTVTAQDVLWETERLPVLNDEPGGRFSLLMHFYTPTGERVLIETTGQLSVAFE